MAELKWSNKMATNGALITPELELKDTEWGETKKKKEKIMYLGAIGSSYGGDIIGQDDKGNDIYVSMTVYKKPHKDTVKNSRSNYKIR